MSQRPRTIGRWAAVAVVMSLALGAGLALFDPATLFSYLPYAGVGAVVVIRRPRNPIGWILIGIAIAQLLTTVPPDADLAAIAAGRPPLRETAYAWLTAWSGRTLFLGFIVLTIILPTGRLPTGRWRRPAVGAVVVGLFNAAVSAFAPTIGVETFGNSVRFRNPLAILPDLGVWDLLAPAGIQDAVVAILLIGGVVSMIVRFHYATGILRLQLRWIMSAAAALVIAVFVSSGLASFFGASASALVWVPALLGYLTLPGAIAIAVLRHRLFDIDRLVSRTIGWAVVTGVLAVTFVAGLLALQAVLSRFTQGQTLAVAASTLATFALFQPVRRRVQRVVDRRFDRAGYDAERTAAAFAERLRKDMDLDSLIRELADTVDRTIAPQAAALWLREP